MKFDILKYIPNSRVLSVFALFRMKPPPNAHLFRPGMNGQEAVKAAVDQLMEVLDTNNDGPAPPPPQIAL